MITLAPDQIAAACAATITSGEPRSSGDLDFPARAAVDSRDVKRGDLFFGLGGEHADGGAFAAQAIERGAWGVVVGAGHAAELSSSNANARVFSVDDPLSSLHGLTGAWLARLREHGCRVVGITGSTGKTSTKDILLALLGPPLDGRVRANRENYNTEVGMPLTVLETATGTEVLILEMAMRGMGQIRELAQIARPEVGAITNVAPVHLELVGTIERVAEAKAELIAELPPRGVCVVPAAEEALYPHLRSDTRVITFDSPHAASDDPLDHVAAVAGASADVRAVEMHHTTTGISAEVVAGAERATFGFNFSQTHNLTNALAAIGCAQALGFPLDALTEGASEVVFSSLRGEQRELDGGVLLINDSYNANPASMRAALDDLALTVARRGSTRAVAILGEMKELGSGSAAFHREIGAYAAERGVALLIAVGGEGDSYAEGFGTAGELQRAADAVAASELAIKLVEPGDTVLVKASRSLGLERVAQALDGIRAERL
jgi:UDP-N-acetylmuramoyl-tripeptide--D-alanyl-D-alanine ligase